MKEFDNCIPGEYLKDVVLELSTVMGIDVDYEEILKASKNDGEPGVHCVCIFKKGNSFILVDVQNIDILKGIVIRCEDTISDNVKAVILKWDILARKRYHQEIRDDIEDRYGSERSLLNDIIKAHKISI